jgi:hypothetical protein
MSPEIIKINLIAIFRERDQKERRIRVYPLSPHFSLFVLSPPCLLPLSNVPTQSRRSLFGPSSNEVCMASRSVATPTESIARREGERGGGERGLAAEVTAVAEKLANFAA